MKILSAVLLLLSSYTLLSVLVQCLLPLAVISLVYGKIYFFLKVILIVLGEKDTSNEFQKRLLNLNRAQKRKMRRTTMILLIISLVFCIRFWTLSSVSQFRKYSLFFSWLPFSILRLVNEVFLDLNNTSPTMLLLHLLQPPPLRPPQLQHLERVQPPPRSVEKIAKYFPIPGSEAGGGGARQFVNLKLRFSVLQICSLPMIF